MKRTPTVAPESKSRTNGIARDTIPPLTRGGLLIERLVQSAVDAMKNPRSRTLHREFAEARTTLERHVKELEIKADAHVPAFKSGGGLGGAVKGWSVSRRTGTKTWRGCTTVGGRFRTVGTFKTRAEAETACKAAVDRLRGKAA